MYSSNVYRRPDWNAFVQTICRDPDDDAPRLVAADWLEEQGEPQRAAFIRLQVEIARAEAEHALQSEREDCECRHCALSNWQRQLYLEHATESWVDGARFLWRPHAEEPGAARLNNWSRGFVSVVRLSCAEFLERAADLFRKLPLNQVVLTDKIPLDDAVDRAEMGDPAIRFRWQRPNNKWFSLIEPRHCLPRLIWDRLGGAGRWKNFYPNQAEALADLSHACVGWARAIAGLPALDRPNQNHQSRFTWCK